MKTKLTKDGGERERETKKMERSRRKNWYMVGSFLSGFSSSSQFLFLSPPIFCQYCLHSPIFVFLCSRET